MCKHSIILDIKIFSYTIYDLNDIEQLFFIPCLNKIFVPFFCNFSIYTKQYQYQCFYSSIFLTLALLLSIISMISTLYHIGLLQIDCVKSYRLVHESIVIWWGRACRELDHISHQGVENLLIVKRYITFQLNVVNSDIVWAHIYILIYLKYKTFVWLLRYHIKCS